MLNYRYFPISMRECTVARTVCGDAERFICSWQGKSLDLLNTRSQPLRCGVVRRGRKARRHIAVSVAFAVEGSNTC